MKTSDLTGNDLDYWAALADGLDKAVLDLGGAPPMSTDWHLGGPIIERERIAIYTSSNRPGMWYAEMDMEWPSYETPFGKHEHKGATPLVAAMRCFVESKFGKEVQESAAPL